MLSIGTITFEMGSKKTESVAGKATIVGAGEGRGKEGRGGCRR